MGLERRGAQVKHTRLGRGVKHGELTANLVRRDGQVAAEILCVTNDIEVLAGGLDHDDVGALADIAGNGPARQAAAARRQLVAPAVTEGGDGARGVAEGSVEAARELGRVGHEERLVGDALLDELELDGADAAVIHIRGSDAVGAGTGVGQRHVRDAVDGELVVEGTVVAEDTAVAVGGVLAKADVGADEELGEALAEEADRLDDRAIRIVGRGTEGVLAAGLEGDAEEHDGLEALVDQGLEEGQELVDAAAVLAGERRDERLLVIVVGHEERVDEHVLRVRD